MGSNQVDSFLKYMDPRICKQIKKKPCHLTFRFGNHATLTAKYMLLLPLQDHWIRIAIVPGPTPFLISNSLLRSMGAVIDTEHETIWFRKLRKQISMRLSGKKLFLMDLNQLWTAPSTELGRQASELPDLAMTSEMETELSRSQDKNMSVESSESSQVEAIIGKQSDSETCDIEKFFCNQENSLPCGGEEFQSHVALKVQAQSELNQDSVRVSHAVPLRSPESYEREAESSPTPSGDDRADSLGDARQENRVWRRPPGKDLQGSLREGEELDIMDDQSIWQKHQARAHDVFPLRAPSTRATGERKSGNSEVQAEPREGSQCERGRGRMVPAGGPEFEPRSRVSHGGDPSDCSSRSQSDEPSYVSAGTDPGTSSSDATASDDQERGLEKELQQPLVEWAFRAEAQKPGTISNDWMQDAHMAMNAHDPNVFHDELTRLVRKFHKELKSALVNPEGNKSVEHWDLLEVFCEPQSQLTHQVQQMKGKAMRWGLAQGDLSDEQNRKKFFQMFKHRRFRHVWCSPTCGPWCKWNQFNALRSLDMADQILQKRREALWQVALSRVIGEYQMSKQQEFHWEQPQGSAMWMLPQLKSLFEVCDLCCFDLRRVAPLSCPGDSSRLIKKGLTVLTSDPVFHKHFHDQRCLRNHDHHAIAGTIQTGHGRISLSEWSGQYSRKFGRQLAHNLLQARRLPSYAQKVRSQGLAAMATESEPPSKKPRLEETGQERPVRDSEPIHAENPKDQKRRRIIGKGGSGIPYESQKSHQNTNTPEQPSEDPWLEMLNEAQKHAPRVGKKCLFSGKVVDMAQKHWPLMEIKVAVVSRGNRRYFPCPASADLHRGEAPFRLMIGKGKHFSDIHVDEQWEAWERLVHQKIYRSCNPATLSIMLFATEKPKPVQALENPPDQATTELQEPTLSNPDQQSVHNSKQSKETDETKEEASERNVIDFTQSHHGPLIHALLQKERDWLIRMHQNLGHPNNQKLGMMLTQQGVEQRLVQAVQDLRCSSCQEAKGPVLGKVATVHEPLDFNAVVSVDGVKWTNKEGKQFNFYHCIDHATCLQMAKRALSTDTMGAIEALTSAWLHWAGPPNRLHTDSGTEFNSEQFESFLQKHDIHGHTIASHAHWQNSRAERHGGILQRILDRMDKENPIRNEVDFDQALWHACVVKNMWSRHRGVSPRMLVFGKNQRLPGSVTSSEHESSHQLAMDESAEGEAFRRDLAYRSAAMEAFAKVDKDQALRRAIWQRNRPSRGWYNAGEWVMIWKPRGLKDGHWSGPMKVILQESNQIVWTTMCEKLYRVAPEHIRPLTGPEVNLIPTKENHVERLQTGVTRFVDLTIPPATSGSSSVMVPEEIPETERSAEIENLNRNISSEQPDHEPGVMSEPQSPENDTSHNPEEIGGNKDGTDVPLPDSADELCCELSFLTEMQDSKEHVMSLPNGHVWECAIEVGEKDIENWKQEANPQEMCFLATAAKKQRSEVRISELTAEDRALFDNAKRGEIQSWLNTGTVERILKHKIPQECIMRSRWILTWKPVESPTEGQSKFKPKARLVVLGFEDPAVTEIPRDAPTLHKLSRTLLLQYACNRHWDLQSFDVKTAFLRGSAQDDRLLGMLPPPEMQEMMQLKPQEVVRLVKGAYGRVDAPYLWFIELKKQLESLGMVSSPFDPCLFILPNSSNPHQIDGLIGIHVDDGLCAGNSRFESVLKRLQEIFPFGSQKRREFVFTGLHLRQNDDGSIQIDQEKYVKDIPSIEIGRERRREGEQPVTEKERHSLRALIGSLQYAAVNTRPDLCAQLSWLQSQINCAKVETLIEGNKCLHEAKMHASTKIVLQPLEDKQMRFLAFTDASFPSNKNPDAQQGMLIMASEEKLARNQTSKVNPILWHSKKIQKVTTSTLSAESMAATCALDNLSWVRLYWGWLQDPTCNWRKLDETLLKLPPAYTAMKVEESLHTSELNDLVESCEVPGTLTTDCRSLFDLINKTASPACQEFRTQLNARLIKEQLSTGIQVRWVPSGAQIADALTKIMDNDMLRTCLMLGKYCLRDEDKILQARSDAKSRLRWLKSVTQST